MWADVHEWKIKNGRMGEAVALVRELERMVGPTVPWRVYSSETGERWVLAVVSEFESWDENERLLAKAMASPEFVSWYGKWQEVREPGTHVAQLWRVQ